MMFKIREFSINEPYYEDEIRESKQALIKFLIVNVSIGFVFPTAYLFLSWDRSPAWVSLIIAVCIVTYIIKTMEYRDVFAQYTPVDVYAKKTGCDWVPSDYPEIKKYIETVKLSGRPLYLYESTMLDQIGVNLGTVNDPAHVSTEDK
ncbi:MAG: hypothetical protein R8M38_09725, partial [Mariprofundaceae bacterium]